MRENLHVLCSFCSNDVIIVSVINDINDKRSQEKSLSNHYQLLQSAFLATLVALHFTPVSESVGDSFGLADCPAMSFVLVC